MPQGSSCEVTNEDYSKTEPSPQYIGEASERDEEDRRADISPEIVLDDEGSLTGKPHDSPMINLPEIGGTLIFNRDRMSSNSPLKVVS